jgi:glucose-1-phosphate cytidylyltransferase
MVEIGGRPMIWHIMKIFFAAHGITEFVVCLGNKGYQIKEYFSNYFLHMSDVTIDLDTLRDRKQLEEVWAGDRAPWKTW